MISPARLIPALTRTFWLVFVCRLLATAGFGAVEPGREVAFDIPAGGALKSLKEFSAQSGQQLLYVNAELAGLNTNEVKGRLTVNDALNRLLAGTPLVASRDSKNGAVAVSRAVPEKSDPNGPRAAQAMAGDRPGRSDDAASGSEKTIELSPFTVNADQDVGYIATSSLAGSRLNTPLRDTPASISVLTSEFLSDIAAINLTEALEWGTNVQLDVADVSGGDNETLLSFPVYRVRGLAATVTRNYFKWQLATDGFNIERIEEQRGPNSILFGIGSAGGVLNSTTKRATLGRNFRKAQVMVGSFDTYRGSLDINQTAINNRLALRFNAVYNKKGSYKQHVYDRTRRADLAATFRPTSTTSLRAEYETGEIDQVNTRATTVVDGVTRWLRAGRPTITTPVTAAAQLTALGLLNYGAAQRITLISNTNQLYNMAGRNSSDGPQSFVIQDESIADRSINTGGPGQKRTGYYDTTSAFLEQRFGEHTFAELAYNHQHSNYLSYIAGQGRSENNRLKADPNQLLPDGSPNPFVGRYMVEGDRWNRKRQDDRFDNTRLTLSHEHDFGMWGNYRVAALGEYEWRAQKQNNQVEVWEGHPFGANPEATANVVWRRTYAVTGEWGTYYMSGPAADGLIKNLPNPLPGGGRPATLNSAWAAFNSGQRDNPDYQKTVLVGGQARYFKGRIVVGLGFRRDQLERVERDPIRDPVTGEFATSYTTAIDNQYSAKTKTTGIVGHVTRNISLFYNYSNSLDLPSLVRVLPDSRTSGNPKSEGRDFGVGLELLDGKINVRVNRYQNDVKGGTDFRFGGTVDNPTVLNTNILRILVDNRLMTQTEADSRRLDTTGITFDRRVEGYEANVTANLSRNWMFRATYSYTKGFESSIGPEVKTWAATAIPFYQKYPQNLLNSDGRTIAQMIADWRVQAENFWELEGLTMQGNRHHKVTVFTHYNFPWQRLKGLFVLGGYQHFSKAELGLDPNNQIRYGNSYWLATAGVGYRIRQAPWIKRAISVQLNVTNLFDWRDPIITGFLGDGSPSRWNILEPRTWRLTASMDF